MLLVGRREAAHLCDETKFSTSSAEKYLAEEVAQENSDNHPPSDGPQ